MSNSVARATSPQTPDDESGIIQPNAKVLAVASAISGQIKMARFRNSPMIMLYEPFPHWSPMNIDMFKDAAYPIVGAVTRSNIGDAWEYLSHTVEDLTPFENHILFGVPHAKDQHPDAVSIVWDMEDLCSFAPDGLADSCMWRSPYATIPGKAIFSQKEYGPIPFIMDLACGDPDMYHDIMLSMAPLVMKQKPDGVVWWVGQGANGKSTLMDALYDIFPNQLTSMNVKQITEDRDLPSLNGYLANVVRESSEGRVDNTENYKSLGTHENFPVHKFHQQTMVTVNANMHHIFSANQVPIFNDKGHSAKRRTHIIPFNAKFKSDPTFKKRTFTPEFYGRLISEMCKYANILKRTNYVYQWKSSITTGTKEEYDDDVNSAESYINSIIRQGVVAFDNLRPLTTDYENWCMENGTNKLANKTLKEAAKRAGFARSSARMGDKVGKPWMLATANSGELQKLSAGRPGLYTRFGYVVEDEDEADPEPVMPDFHEPPAEKETVPPEDNDTNFKPTRLRGEW